MTRVYVTFGAALLCAVAATGAIHAQSVDGTWKIDYISPGAVEQTVAVVKLHTTDGKLTGELVAVSPRYKILTLQSVALDGPRLSIALQSGASTLTFAADLPSDLSKRLLGSFAINETLYPASVEKTDLTELKAANTSRNVACPPMIEARNLSQKGLALQFRAQQTKDAEQKKALLQQAFAAAKEARTEIPKLHRAVLEKYGDTPAVFEAALSLIRGALVNEATPEEIKSWAMTAAKAARAYGSRWHGDFATQLATALVNQENMVSLALDFARDAEKALAPGASATEQAKVLGVLERALRKLGKTDEAKQISGRLAKLDDILDREYLAKMPPFKGTPFRGRQSKSERAVFMELFTGATCPPCVAADLAFDVLAKTYKPSELVLIQYHMHIPGPDPMTNPDTEARWEYYRKSYPMEIRGVPSSLFNGKPKAGGGGGVDFAEKKYEAYRDIINPLLDLPAGAKITAHAQQVGSKIGIQVEVADLVEPSADKKLRVLLAEESIRYVGSNKIRFHHNVVRAFPGGVEGRILKSAGSKHTYSLNLTELRAELIKYLDEYEANKRPFANPARPLEFNNLRVIAFVQDDATREILQAVQVEVEKK